MTCTTCRLIFFERELVSCKSKSALYVIHSFIGPDCVFCNVSAQHETCEREKESPLPSSCVSWGNMLPRSMVKIKECRECVFSICRPPPLLPSPILPRVSITVSLHLSLARAGRSFLMLTHTQTHKHTHKHRVEHPFQLKWSTVKCTHTHTHCYFSYVPC